MRVGNDSQLLMNISVIIRVGSLSRFCCCILCFLLQKIKDLSGWRRNLRKKVNYSVGNNNKVVKYF